MEQHQEELATIEALDAGAVYTLALKTHVGMSIQTFRYFAGWCDKIQVGRGLHLVHMCVFARVHTGSWGGWCPARHAAQQLPQQWVKTLASQGSAGGSPASFVSCVPGSHKGASQLSVAVRNSWRVNL